MKTNTYRKYKKPGVPINGKQITIIKMACNFLGIPREEEHDMLEERYGVRSCTKLTYDQASEFIRELEGKGFTLKPNAKAKQTKVKPAPRPAGSTRGQGNVIALPRQDEIDKMNAVAALIQWREENGLGLFLMKRMGIKQGKIRTAQDCYLAIEGLKKMFENQMKAQHGPNWWVMKFAHKGITEYIKLHKPAEYR
ncbi:MAG: DUF1018 domain-containing protein [Geobacteraceae bacterium]|nr:DUF1018 domain-containing protein [Geobacteraceae bacterium]